PDKHPYYTEVLLDFDEGTTEFNVGGKTPMVIKEIRSYTTGETPVVGKLDGHDLAVVGRGAFGSVTRGAWQVGHKVDFNTTVNFVDHGTPNGIKEAVSGNIMAMKNGEIQPLTTSTTPPYGQGGYDNTMYPRTLYGVNADRTKFYIVVCEHNLKNPTRYQGFSTEQLCIMARDHFGVSNAIQVDCGGSTQMYAKGGNVARSYDNVQGERAVYNGVFVCYNDNDVKLPDPGTYEDEEDPNIQDPDKGWVDSGERAHFAYGLSTATDGRGVPTANYFLTGDVKAVDVILTNTNDDTDVVTIAGGTAKGLNAVYVDDPALKEGTTYKWAVKVYSNPVTGTSHFLHDAPGKLDARGGVGVVMDPESPAYGNLIYSMGYAQGFGMYNPDGTKAGNYHAGMAPWVASNRSDLYRIAMRDKNTAYACCFSDKGAGYWKFDPTNPTQAPENLSGGVNDGTGCFKMPGSDTCVGSGASGIAFQRKADDEEYFWVFAEDWPNGNNKDFIGILGKWKTNFETKIEHGLMGAVGELAGTGIFKNQNVCVTGIPGGVFCAQGRGAGSNTTSIPGFVYVDEGFNVLYNSGNEPNLFTSCGGSVAISDDLSLFAVSGYSEHIKIYDVTWNGNVPSFKFRALVNETDHVNEVSQLAFDPAGNLYAWQRSTSGDYCGLFGYSWKNDAPEALTPAKANDLILAQRFTGIDNIVTDADSATPVYYTVQGVRVDNANLVPGLYIKVTGRKAEKVVIK
ncbi:MAG: phosphodiester glycosidase family protein, partial [Muribaculaceae bacterium]|nr:phosphodiester glycosidase family protein [Muribaculaceae bacterium]